MKRALISILILSVTVGFASSVMADSLEGVWALKSGQWGDAETGMVYPSGPKKDEGALAFRTFTSSYHFFVSSFPTEEIYNASVSKYSVDGNVLRMNKVLTKNPEHEAQWEWTFELDGDQLNLKREGMSEVWVRVE